MSQRSERLRRLLDARLYLVTDDRLPLERMLDRLEAALKAGVRVVQYRAKTLERGELLRQAQAVQRLCRTHGALFIVNDAADIAALTDADGLHLGQDDLSPALARRLVGEHQLVGLSVSALDEAQLAASDPAVDYLGVGAMYATPTKPEAEFGGLELLRQVRTAVRLPLVAIGGISAERAPEVWAGGADLIAVVSAVFSASDPAGAVQALFSGAPGRLGEAGAG